MKRPIRRLIVRWLWPEIYWKMIEPERLATQRLIDEGWVKDSEREFVEHLARNLP